MQRRCQANTTSVHHRLVKADHHCHIGVAIARCLAFLLLGLQGGRNATDLSVQYCSWANAAAAAFIIMNPPQPKLYAAVYALTDGPLAGALIVWQSAWVFGSASHSIRSAPIPSFSCGFSRLQSYLWVKRSCCLACPTMEPDSKKGKGGGEAEGVHIFSPPSQAMLQVCEFTVSCRLSTLKREEVHIPSSSHKATVAAFVTILTA